MFVAYVIQTNFENLTMSYKLNDIFTVQCMLYLIDTDGLRNDRLKTACKRIHDKLVTSVDPRSVIDRLFSDGVLSAEDNSRLCTQGQYPVDGCRQMLSILHLSHHPRTFISFVEALREKTNYEWLVTEIEQVYN